MPVRQKQTAQAPVFTERTAWRQFGTGWVPLHGSVLGSGVSFEWHDFKTHAPFDWGQSFHPRTVEICLNLEGDGKINTSRMEAEFAPMTVGFYCRAQQPLHATREANQRHQFLSIEMSLDFLQQQLGEFVTSLHPLVRDVVSERPEKSFVAPVALMNSLDDKIKSCITKRISTGMEFKRAIAACLSFHNHRCISIWEGKNNFQARLVEFRGYAN